MRCAQAWCSLPLAVALLLGLPALVPGAARAQPAAVVPRPELAEWLRQHPAVRWAPEQDYPPMVFSGANGQADGLSVQLLDLVAHAAGLGLQPLPPAPLHQLLQAARERRLDLLTSLRPTPERAEFLLFTRPYVSVPAVLVHRQGTLLPDGLASLAGQPVAVGQGYAVEAVVRARHPQVRWQAVPDDAQALRGVAAGRFDAAVVDSASYAYLVQREGLRGLAAGSQVGFSYDLCFAVRKDWPQLRDLLDEGIRAVPETRRQEVLARWLQPATEQPLPPRTPWATRLGALLLVLGVLLGGWLAWRRHRRTGHD
jgi:ABC-type amino acid transport substrate-binding protein